MRIKFDIFTILHYLIIIVQSVVFILFLLKVIDYNLALQILVSATVLGIANALAEGHFRLDDDDKD